VRDYLHVADAAAGLMAIAASDLVGPVNLSSGEGVTLRAALEAIEAAAGTPGMVHFGEVPYGPAEWMWMRGDNAKLLATGWRPTFSLEKGIADTVAWWRQRMPTL
jgi:nucleoside-diphosphate-sugar epimerase